VFLFNFFLIGTIGDPMPYIALAMGYLAVKIYPKPEPHALTTPA
jgi:hypothetical protein